MSILPYQEIQNLIKTKKLITNADLDKCLSPASYELRIGSVKDFGGGEETKLDVGQRIVMEPGASALIGTLEEVHLPSDIAGFLYLKSSLGRAGYIPWSQGYVDPGYRGSLTIALHNIAGKLQLFEYNQKICHLVLMKLTKATSNPYDGEYSGSTGATEAKQKPPIVIGASGVLARTLGIAGEAALKTAVEEGVKTFIDRT